MDTDTHSDTYITVRQINEYETNQVIVVITNPTSVMERKELTKCCQSSLLNVDQLFHDSNGHDRPFMIMTAILQHCRFLRVWPLGPSALCMSLKDERVVLKFF